jgi:hypothetical protein
MENNNTIVESLTTNYMRNSITSYLPKTSHGRCFDGVIQDASIGLNIC